MLAMDSDGGSALTSAQKDALMDKVKQEIMIANFQELLQKMTEKCFKQCINKPGTSLDNSEQKCLAMCMDRYLDAYNTVSRAYSTRIQQEHHQ
ncbi:mitochondrial import inner membrane translocase subunit Tim13-A [Phymastichus coffea]|uniref:mitochondrial import inner membrane translocase subunit Tim13-A n=1 Tax=Phymastichus coffea TaxID=108790 RepID=UPI00273BD388|nr:mitochondrial import inner membrane translocase subunit Tim13-A [Phymastichus coffea]XP_058802255.1 mitochondrial import inner membrane translocase subunit Tim13-A [Phymastichus coffea]XP_058802256.1 mitochondrial import inner membrane translocase subunit Tim13-A [Phymastichus coffea]XP_058802257.1 mitochondrial import inner membrane translocase subunit Tim13-A [Phymastichus coffea]